MKIFQQHNPLLPFPVDHLGGLGPLAYRLLFGPDRHKAPDPAACFPNIRTKWRNTLHNGPRTQLPYWLTMPSWWKLDQHTPIYPIRTLSPHHPSHWAQQFLGLNFTCLLTNHLQRRLHKLQAIQQWQQFQSSTRKKLYDHVGRTFYTRSSYCMYKSLAQPAHALLARLVICGTLDELITYSAKQSDIWHYQCISDHVCMWGAGIFITFITIYAALS
jgi:hypothetical protein